MVRAADHREKLGRARLHIDALKASMLQLHREPSGPRIMLEQDAARLEIRLVANVPPLSPEWSLLLGDALHNARSALDNLAFALALDNMPGLSAKEEKQVEFPILEEKPDDEGEPLRGTRFLSASAQTTIERLQPYHPTGWNYPRHPLALLHLLNNVDKHRRLVLGAVAVVQGTLRVHNRKSGDVVDVEVDSGLVEGRAVLASYQVSDGAQFWELSPAGGVGWDIVFADPPQARGLQVTAFLDVLLAYIEREVFGRLGPQR